MKRRYERTPVEALELMPNAELVEGFEYLCMTICNAHNFTRYGPSSAMRDDREAYVREILNRMQSGKARRRSLKRRGNDGA